MRQFAQYMQQGMAMQLDAGTRDLLRQELRQELRAEMRAELLVLLCHKCSINIT